MRGIEADVLPVCLQHGIGVLSWSPLAGGWLSGRYRKDRDVPSSHRAERIPDRYDMTLPGNQRKLEAVDQLGRLADESKPMKPDIGEVVGSTVLGHGSQKLFGSFGGPGLAARPGAGKQGRGSDRIVSTGDAIAA